MTQNKNWREEFDNLSDYRWGKVKAWYESILEPVGQTASTAKDVVDIVMTAKGKKFKFNPYIFGGARKW